MAKIILVDATDLVVGVKERTEISSSDIYRVSALWVTNSKGKILLARRAFTKSNDPGKWGPAVAGTVEEGETYQTNIKKETFEELGVSDIEFVVSCKLNNTSKERKHKYFSQWFTVKIDKRAEDFNIDSKEVAEVKWFTQKELKEAVIKQPEQFLEIIKKWVSAEIIF